MRESNEPNASQDESLADLPPTPVNEPGLPVASNVGLGTIALATAGAGALLLIAGSLTPTVGATRSAQLEWERRALQIEQAARDARADITRPDAAQSDAAKTAPTDAPQDGTNDSPRNNAATD